MSFSDYFDRDGNLLTVEQYSELIRAERDGQPYKFVAKTQVPEADAEVSTVWLGLDHRYGGSVPIIFETMVFGGGLADEAERYATEAEARAGHEAMVQRVRDEARKFALLVAQPEVRAAVLALHAAQTAYREAVGGDDHNNGDYARVLKAVLATAEATS